MMSERMRHLERYVVQACPVNGSPDGAAVLDTGRGEVFCLVDPVDTLGGQTAMARAKDIADMFNRPVSTELAELRAKVADLGKLLNTPEVDDFAKGVVLEAAHQRQRWGADHDAGKAPADWFWLLGYLAQKAMTAAINGDHEKALHHTISTAAALANWHLALKGVDTSMRPGIAPPVVTA